MVAHAAVRGIEIEELESELEGDIDLRGFLGLAMDVPKEYTNSEYSRFVIHVEKERCVPLLTLYWDDKDVQVKELTAPLERVEEIDGDRGGAPLLHLDGFLVGPRQPRHVVALRHEPLHDTLADDTGRTGDEDPHGFPPAPAERSSNPRIP